MTVPDCDRWATLADQRALGELLESAELRFLRDHSQSCELCGAENRAFDRLADSLDDPRNLTEPFPLRERGGVLRRLAGRARTARTLAVAVLAAAAAVPAFFWARHARERSSATSALSSRATLVLSAGEASVDGAPARLGALLRSGARLDVREGRACTGFEPGVWACLGQRSLAEVGTLAEHRTLKLLSGRVLARLEPQPAGRTFSVSTAEVEVLAKGTLFAVQAEPKQSTVRLYEGSVRLRAHDGRELLMRAPAEAKVGNGIEVKALLAPPAASDAELIALSRLGSNAASCRLGVSSLPLGAQVSLDGTALGPAPIAALVRPGAARLALELDGYAPVSERVTLASDAAVTRDYELASLPERAVDAEPVATPRASAEPAAAEAAPRATPAELLTRARNARASGRYAEAARTYRQLTQTYPHSDEARVAQVSLGELWLSELSDPKAALAAFESYLKQGGGLSQEARYGKIRALGRLGRTTEERAAIERFLLDYPKSVQAASLRAKLENR